jgi:hypothetical protein
MGDFEPEQFGGMMAALDLDAGGVDRVQVADADDSTNPAGRG